VSASVHAIVVNFRTPDLTMNAVTHLRASDLPPGTLDVWVVDNDSGDDSAARLQACVPGARLLLSPRNLGFAGGNNLALQRVLELVESDAQRRDAFVLLLNSDTEVAPNALGSCLEFMRAHPRAGVVGPKVVLPDGKLDLACRRGFPTPANAFWKLTGLARRFPRNPRFSGYNLTHLDEDETAEVDAVMGAFMLVRLSAVADVGLLDEQFFMYGEDLDWAYRLKAHGWQVWYYPLARVRHLKGATTRKQSRRMLVEFYRAMWLFHRKHYAARNVFLLNWLVVSGIALRGALAVTVNALRPEDRKRVA
jgi:N-acetylglucosaminyl-diphospho-decaprenol L-rhamnosyltransferase